MLAAEIDGSRTVYHMNKVEAIEVGDVEAAHGFPTLATGAACDEIAEPYLNACDYDAAGKLLAALHGELQPRAAAAGELRRISQPGADDATMLDDALLYVPKSCAAGEACGLHVALHGCLQSAEKIRGRALVGGDGDIVAQHAEQTEQQRAHKVKEPER